MQKITQAEARDALNRYPISKEINHYGYHMTYDTGRKKWLAAYECEGTTWYVWEKGKFEMISALGTPWEGITISLESLQSIARWMFRIEEGNVFMAVVDVIIDGNPIFLRGKEYTSEVEDCITCEDGEQMVMYDQSQHVSMKELNRIFVRKERVLKFTITKEWFDMLGHPKDEEYRHIKKFNISRLLDVKESFKNLPREEAIQPGDYDDYLKDIEFDLLVNGATAKEVFDAYRTNYRQYDVVKFYMGASLSSKYPTKIFQLKEITIGKGREEWGAEKDVPYFTLHLGNRI